MGCGGRAAGAGGWVVFCGADVLVVAGSAQNSRSGVNLNQNGVLYSTVSSSLRHVFGLMQSPLFEC